MDEILEELKDLKLYCALPSYNGERSNGVPIAWMHKMVPNSILGDSGGSLLANVFNAAYCLALRQRDMGNATHFLMLHADIVPQGDDWFAKLWRAYRTSKAQMISAVVPIKSAAGLTSTAFELPDPKKRWTRLTMNEVMGGPETFSSVWLDEKGSIHPPGPGLAKPPADPVWMCDSYENKDGLQVTRNTKILLNTGMLLFDLREPWVNHCYFTITDEIVWVNSAGEVTVPGAEGAVPTAKSTSEDWAFTRMAREHGCERIFATRAVPLQHVGQQRYPNYQAWGMPEDDGTQ